MAMTDTAPERSRAHITDEIAISIENMNKWYGTLPRAA